jgi:hypothetical protein
MSKFRVRQLRSGEGAILTDLSNQSLSELPRVLPELLEKRVLIVAGEGLPKAGPRGAESVAEGAWALRGDDAARFLAEADGRDQRGLIWALCDELPSDDVVGRCLPDPLRPWDNERLDAVAYAQSGKRYAHQGVWFRDEEQRRRWVEAAVARLLDDEGVGLPAGDSTLVLELPTDSTFDAAYTLRGRGDSLRIKRDFGHQGFEREWWIERGEWKGEETRRPKRETAPLAQRLTQGVATAGIFLLSLPVSVFVFFVLLTSKLATDSTSTSRAANRPS